MKRHCINPECHNFTAWNQTYRCPQKTVSVIAEKGLTIMYRCRYSSPDTFLMTRANQTHGCLWLWSGSTCQEAYKRTEPSSGGHRHCSYFARHLVQELFKLDFEVKSDNWNVKDAKAEFWTPQSLKYTFNYIINTDQTTLHGVPLHQGIKFVLHNALQ